MIFTDGLTAILVFSGLFAAGAMHWATLEMLAYGIILSLAAVAGGLLAGRLDDAVGPKTSLKFELGLLIAIEALALGMGRNRLFYTPWNGEPLWNGPMFTTLPELVFLGLGCIIAITVTAAYASSRTMLTRVAPPEQLGVFFGLYVLSGAATMWLGPLLIEAATHAGGSQAIGLTPILGMLAVGWALLFAVRGGGPIK
jgi:UMF1 family MFS transporter